VPHEQVKQPKDHISRQLPEAPAIRERPAYAQLRERAREIERLKNEF
jgi:hypothetical protein